MTNDSTYKYFAFISYSRKDSKAAKWLQRRLEWFRFPVKMVAEEARPVHPKYIRPVYRDKTNLEVDDAHYWENIKGAILQSRFLIVLCSPDSASSQPVDMEIRHFLSDPKRKDVLADIVPVILKGNVGIGDESESLCPALLEQGSKVLARNLPTMVPDGDDSEKEGWENGFVGVASYLLQLKREALSDHCQREERKRARRSKLLSAVFALLAILAVTGGIVAWQQRQGAVNKEHQIQVQSAQSDFLIACEKVEQERPDIALAHLARAVQNDPQNLAIQAKLTFLVQQMGGARLEVLLKHSSKVRTASFSPNGRKILTTSDDNKVHVWDSKTGDRIGKPIEHKGQIQSAKFSPDSERIATASKDGTSQVWDANTGLAVGKPIIHKFGSVYSAIFSPNGKMIVTCGASDKIAQIWDADSGEVISKPLKHKNNIQSASFSWNNRWVATTTLESIHLWDATTGESIGIPMRSEGLIKSAAFNNTDEYIICETYDSFEFWDVKTCVQIHEAVQKPLRHRWEGALSTYSPNKRRVASPSGESIRIWNSATDETICDSIKHESCTAVSFDPTARRIVTASLDKTAQVWDATSTEVLGRKFQREGSIFAIHDNYSRIVMTPESQTSARVLDCSTGRFVGKPMQHEDPIESATFSRNGNHVVTVSEYSVKVWDWIEGEMICPSLDHDQSIAAAEFSPNGSTLLITDDNDVITVWDTTTGKSLYDPIDLGCSIAPPVFSADGSEFAVMSEDAVHIFSGNSGKLTNETQVENGRITSLKYSNGSWKAIFVMEDLTIQLRDVSNSAVLLKAGPYSDDSQMILIGPLGHKMVIVDGNQSEIWDTTTGKIIGNRIQHESQVKHLSFDSSGNQSLTATEHVVRVLDTNTGKLVGENFKYEDLICSCSFSPNGKWIIIVSLNTITGQFIINLQDIESAKSLARFTIDEPWVHSATLVNGERTLMVDGAYHVQILDILPDISYSESDIITLRDIAWVTARRRIEPTTGVLQNISPRESLALRQTLSSLNGASGLERFVKTVVSPRVERPTSLACDQRYVDIVSLTNSGDFLEAAEEGDLVKIANCLDAGIDIDTSDEDGNTALLLAAGYPGVVNYLLHQYEKRVNRINGDAPSPIHMQLGLAYLMNGRLEEAKNILMEYVGSVDSDGNSWNDGIRKRFELVRTQGFDFGNFYEIEHMLDVKEGKAAPRKTELYSTKQATENFPQLIWNKKIRFEMSLKDVSLAPAHNNGWLLTASSENDIVVMKLDHSAEPEWIKKFGGPGIDIPGKGLVSSSGKTYLVPGVWNVPHQFTNSEASQCWIAELSDSGDILQSSKRVLSEIESQVFSVGEVFELENGQWYISLKLNHYTGPMHGLISFEGGKDRSIVGGNCTPSGPYVTLMDDNPENIMYAQVSDTRIRVYTIQKGKPKKLFEVNLQIPTNSFTQIDSITLTPSCIYIVGTDENAPAFGRGSWNKRPVMVSRINYDGNVVWTNTVDSTHGGSSRLCTAGVLKRHVIVASGNKLWCLDYKNGSRIWDYELEDTNGIQSITISGNNLLVNGGCDEDGRLKLSLLKIPTIDETERH